MQKLDADTRLTDALERELMARAIEEQMRFKPGKALKEFFSELFAKLARKDDATGEAAHSAS